MTTAGPAADGRLRRGRRPGPSTTRDALLAAARARFVRHGYDRASLRMIAADAGVDAAMIIHFFTSKERLFAAALHMPVDHRRTIESVLDGPRHRLGERLVRAVLGPWDSHSGEVASLIGSTTATETAAAAVREYLAHTILAPLVAELGVDRAALRVELCASQILGLAVARHALRFEHLALAGQELLVAAVGPTLQRYLTGRLTPAVLRSG